MHIEQLESRELFSGSPLPWPAAPLDRRAAAVPVYVNQNGTAVVQNQILNRRHPVNAYNLFFDDSGSLAVSTTGAVTDLAFYSQPGVPSVTNTLGNHHGAMLTGLTVDDTKPTLYTAVQSHVLGSPGAYTMNVAGPAEGFMEPVMINPKTNAGSDGSDISGTNDYDFYQFQIPRPGNWVFSAIPDNKAHDGESQHLDATINVYDAAGNPVGGSFTSAIDQHGAGMAETWTGVGLKAGSVYYLRVDGAGDSTGGYGVSCELAPGTDVSIVSNTPKMTLRDRRGATFTVSRVDNSTTPLTVHYTVSGTAIAGQQYSALSGVVVIPAGQLSATIQVAPIAGAMNGDKTVVLSLSADPTYNIGPTTASGAAVLDILGKRR